MAKEPKRKYSATKIEFKITEAHLGLRSFVAACYRRAVLYPLQGTPKKQNEAFAIAKASVELLRTRRKRLQDLRKLQAPGVDTRSYGYQENCPPFAVSTMEKGQICRLDHLCPFCWGREVIRPVMRSVLDCFPLVEVEKVDRPPSVDEWWLAHISEQLIYSEVSAIIPGHSLREQLQREAACIRTSRMSRRAWQKYLGSVVWTMAEPQQDGWWKMTRRRLTLVPSFVDDPELTPCNSEFPEECPQHIACTTSGDLINAVAKALPYPTWLMHGDPEQVALWLRARKGIRLSGKCGKLRRSH